MFGITFEDREREIGLRLFEDGHVELEPPKKDGFHEACVTNFKRRFWVWLSIKGNSIEHECDCPLFEDDGIGCEHLYALLLSLGEGSAAEEQPSETSADDPLQINYCLLTEESEAAGAPVLQLMDGDGRTVSMEAESWQRVEDPLDIEALSSIGRLCGGLRSARQGGGFLQHRGPFTLSGIESRDALNAVLSTGRLFVLATQKSKIVGPLHPTQGSPAQFHLRVGAVTQTHSEISAVLIDEGGQVRQTAESDALVAGEYSFVIEGGRLSTIDAAGSPDILRQFRADGPKRVQTENMEPLLAQLGSQQPLPIVLTESTPIESGVKEAECIGRVHIDRRGDLTALRLTFLYGALEIAADSNATRPFDPATHRQIERNGDAEADCAAQMVSAGASPDSDVHGLFWIDTEEVSFVIASLHTVGLQCLLDRRMVRRGSSLDIDIKTGDSILSVSLRIPGKTGALPLTALLASWRNRRDAILLEDGTALIPGESMRDKLDRLLHLEDIAQESADDALQFGRSSAILLDSLLPEESAARDRAFSDIVERLDRDIGHTQIDLSTVNVKATLRPYQEAGVHFLSRLHQLGLGGCLADDMGLGKTLQVLTHLLIRITTAPDSQHLVVVPRSLLFNWRQEASTFTPYLRVHTYHGPKRSLDEIENGTVILTTYGVLLRDQDRLSQLSFEVCVFDEAQALKNPSAKTTRAAHAISASQKLTLTGTPLENSVGDLWSLMDVTNPGLFGGKRGFDRLNMADDSAREAVRRALRPVLLRRTKQEVLPDLPPLIEQTLLVEMSAEQQGLYDELQGSIASAQSHQSDAPNSSALMLEALLRLRQMACHPRLVLQDSAAPSGKLEILTAHLHELSGEGRKSLVFSQFTSLLDLVGDELDTQGINWARLDGSTRDRAQVVERFQTDPSISVFLISLKAGGTGLNLTAADCVFILDPWWNPASEAQASARAHRIGQERSVFVQRIISRGTVEEAIMELKGKKQELSDALLQGGAGATSLNRDDLLALLQPDLS